MAGNKPNHEDHSSRSRLFTTLVPHARKDAHVISGAEWHILIAMMIAAISLEWGSPFPKISECLFMHLNDAGGFII
jgi:hypothetical protein